jgi:curved DNA-binding protein CbpA
VLGVRPGATDEEVRSAYRQLVQLHHPDHNGGSPESARRFEEVQEAYSQITAQRRRSPVRPSSPPPPTDPDLEARLASLERELREKAAAAREKAQRAARAAAAAATSKKPGRPSDEELGYIKTDDTIGKILADARDEFSRRFGDVREEPVTHRAADLLEDLAGWLKGDHAPDGKADKPDGRG